MLKSRVCTNSPTILKNILCLFIQDFVKLKIDLDLTQLLISYLTVWSSQLEVLLLSNAFKCKKKRSRTIMNTFKIMNGWWICTPVGLHFQDYEWLVNMYTRRPTPGWLCACSGSVCLSSPHPHPLAWGRFVSQYYKYYRNFPKLLQRRTYFPISIPRLAHPYWRVSRNTRRVIGKT